ncbi:MAG TPA: hypothetical protein VLA19_30290 [Herpetosiphonaceae bacterium]|nr:hypothetical protein [Herpetosiphonaceae bacterium]
MPMNPDLINEALNLPSEDEPDVQGYDLQATLERPILEASTVTRRRYPSCPCRGADGSFTEAAVAHHDAWDFLRDYPDPRVYSAAAQLDKEDYASWDAGKDRFVDAMAAHFPGLALAIRQIAEHCFESMRADNSICCEDGART